MSLWGLRPASSIILIVKRAKFPTATIIRYPPSAAFLGPPRSDVRGYSNSIRKYNNTMRLMRCMLMMLFLYHWSIFSHQLLSTCCIASSCSMHFQLSKARCLGRSQRWCPSRALSRVVVCGLLMHLLLRHFSCHVVCCLHSNSPSTSTEMWLVYVGL